MYMYTMSYINERGSSVQSVPEIHDIDVFEINQLCAMSYQWSCGCVKVSTKKNNITEFFVDYSEHWKTF